MSQRHEFVLLADAESANLRQLCRRFHISPTTAYKWLDRFHRGGVAALADRSRRPHHSPARTPDSVEREVLSLRDEHPAWGGRKLRARLLALERGGVPAASTITSVLRRHGRLDPQEGERHRPFRRFEHAQPNDLWQMDFKGDFALARGRCHPLTVLDDHSRFALGLVACPDQSEPTTRSALTEVFRRYGLPLRMTMDNGAPWAAWHGEQSRYTEFTAWLIRLGVRVSHSRPRHPQTQGKDERFHRTLKLELLRGYAWRDLRECQRRFDPWRETYNCERPHEALGMAVPASRYRLSPRPFPERLPPIEYPASDIVRKVGERGQIRYRQRKYFVGGGFRGLHVGLRPTSTDGLFEVYFCHQRVGRLDLKGVASEQSQVSTMSANTCP
jgi:transposase InsO family protein